MAIPVPIIAAGITAAGSLGSSLLNKKSKAKQVPLEPPEVSQARRDLLAIGQTGKYLDTNLGEGYDGRLGDFEMTDVERAGQGKLASFVNAGRPEVFGSGTKVLNDLLTSGRFDPNDPKGEYAAFQAQSRKDLEDSITATKRGLAYSGDLYSTDAGRQISDQVLRSNLAQKSKLAELNDKYVQRRLEAIPLAGQMAAQEQELDLMPIDASRRYGSLERDLSDAEAKASLTEWIRARQEKMSGIDAIKAAAGTPANYGVPEVEANVATPWSSLVSELGQFGASELMRKYFLQGDNATA